MDLSSIKTEVVRNPIRAIIYGMPGVGKTTLCCSFPNVVVIPAEDGADSFNVAKFPKPTTFTDVISALSSLYEGEHEFRTIVIDSASAVEQLAEAEVISEESVNSLADIPYGKGQVRVGDKFTLLLQWLDALRMKGYNVFMTAHSVIKPFNDPAGDAYDHYTLALNEKHVSPKLVRWADMVLFCEFDKSTKTVGEGFQKRTIAKSWGQRIINTEERASHLAKNRFNLPEKINMSYADLTAAINLFYQPQEAATNNPVAAVGE